MGKACLAAACCFPFEAVVGVEVLEGLHTLALAVTRPSANRHWDDPARVAANCPQGTRLVGTASQTIGIVNP